MHLILAFFTLNTAQPNTWGGSVFIGDQLRPSTRGRGPSATQFWEFFSIYAHTLWRRTTKFGVVTHVGEGHALGGQPRHCIAQIRWRYITLRTLHYVIYVLSVESSVVGSSAAGGVAVVRTAAAAAVADKTTTTTHKLRAVYIWRFLSEPVFENTYFMFFFQISKNMTFYVFLKWRSKKVVKSL